MGREERVLRDGKRKKVRPKKEARRYGVVRVVSDGLIQASDKTVFAWDMKKADLRYEVNLENGDRLSLMDPEKCLHVGKHDRRYGLIYRFKEYHNGLSKPYFISRRGLVDWDGEGGVERMKEVALAAVLRESYGVGGILSKKMLSKVLEPDLWGSDKFWRGLLAQHKEAMMRQIVYDVMTS